MRLFRAKKVLFAALLFGGGDPAIAWSSGKWRTESVAGNSTLLKFSVTVPRPPGYHRARILLRGPDAQPIGDLPFSCLVVDAEAS